LPSGDIVPEAKKKKKIPALKDGNQKRPTGINVALPHVGTPTHNAMEITGPN
jgi:hypothetical protein